MTDRRTLVNFDGTLVSEANPLPSAPNNYHLEIARGNVTGITKVTKFGRNPDVAAGTTEEVWSVSVNRTRLTTAATIEAISTTDADSGAGGSNPASTGAQIITISGIDENWAEASEDITMDGTTASSATTTKFFRLNRAYVKQTGTYGGTNEGTITIRVSSAGSTQAQLEIGKGQTEMAMYTVPTGKTAYINTLWFNADASRQVACELYRYTGIDDTSTPFVGAKRKLWGQTAVDAGIHLVHNIEDLFTVEGPADIIWEVTAAAGGAAAVEAGFDLKLVTN